jgi:UDPglucose 6-dehydrogenase
MNITIVGTGYVGLVSGVCFSEIGNNVTCVDIDKRKIENLKKSISPIYEPGLEALISKNIEAGRLNFSTSLQDSIDNSEVIFIAVGTPSTSSGEADLQYVEKVAAQIGEHLDGYKLIVTKSTVPVGTNKRLKEIIKGKLKKAIDFDIASNPEFLREGSAVKDTLEMERAVIGVESNKAESILRDLHAPFNTEVVVSDIETAEMTKYAANAFLATKISFINEIATLCEAYGSDVSKVAEGMGLDDRIGNKFLKAGLGYGGSCFPKDTKALIEIGKKVNYEMKIVQQVEQVNYLKRKQFIDKVEKAFNHSLSNKKIGVLGLAFKPNTDDMRDAPAIDIINELTAQGAMITAYDPIAMEKSKEILHHVDYADSAERVFENADAVLIITDWAEFKDMDYKALKEKMRQSIIIDGRNILPIDYMETLGYYYDSIGRKLIQGN